MFDLTGKYRPRHRRLGRPRRRHRPRAPRRRRHRGLHGTRTGPLEALAAELGDRAHVLPCRPLGPRRRSRRCRSAAAEAMGSVDILVNNAGITRDNLFMRMSDDDWDRGASPSTSPPSRGSAKGVLRGMMKARWGRIVNISSVVGATGNPGQANYAAAKAGMIGLSKSLAAEVATPRHHRELRGAGLHRHGDDRQAHRRPEGRASRPVPAAAWAPPRRSRRRPVSREPEAAYVTGATLHVNGGMAML